MKLGLGTQLAHLLELLDVTVQESYTHAGLLMRPRYTPVLRALLKQEPSTISQIAAAASITQPAATQTIALMIKDGLISSTKGTNDARQRLIRLTDKVRQLLPDIQACWAATEIAADSLDNGMNFPLSLALDDAITQLQSQSFNQRIATARAQLTRADELS